MEIMGIFTSLWADVSSSSIQGMICVGAILLYFAFIFGMALYRVKKGDHLHEGHAEESPYAESFVLVRTDEERPRSRRSPYSY